LSHPPSCVIPLGGGSPFLCGSSCDSSAQTISCSFQVPAHKGSLIARQNPVKERIVKYERKWRKSARRTASTCMAATKNHPAQRNRKNSPVSVGACHGRRRPGEAIASPSLSGNLGLLKRSTRSSISLGRCPVRSSSPRRQDAKTKMVEFRGLLCWCQPICDQRGLAAGQDCGSQSSDPWSWVSFRSLCSVTQR